MLTSKSSHFASSQHNRFVSDSKDKEPDVLFVGDSLIQLMHQFGVYHIIFVYITNLQYVTLCHVLLNITCVQSSDAFICLQIWRQLFSPLHALNFGVGGDATQHVLWRLTNGELDNISPKVLNTAKNGKHDHSCIFTQ